MKTYGPAYTRGLLALRDDTLEGDVDTEIIHQMTEAMTQLQTWQDADRLVATIRSRSPDMKGLSL